MRSRYIVEGIILYFIPLEGSTLVLVDLLVEGVQNALYKYNMITETKLFLSN